MMAHPIALRVNRILVGCAVVLLLGIYALPAEAQSLLPQQGLSFGVLLPGFPRTVTNEDADRGVIDIVGTGRSSYLFTPPVALVSPQGNTIPLTFAPDDAVVRLRNGNTIPLVPGTPVSVNIPPGLAPAVIHIGGTASPAAGQQAGSYSATLVVQIVPAGV